MLNQFKSHPLKWETLRDTIERSGLENPDIWIEDLRRYGACVGKDGEVKPTIVCEEEDTDAVEASFSTITDKKNNRIIIRHHY